MIDKSYYVYSLNDPDSDKPFYIGKGKGNRASAHMRPGRRHENPRKWAKIQSIIDRGKEVSIIIIQNNMTEKESLDLEESLIIQYGRLDFEEDGILTNRRKRGVSRQAGWQPYKREKRKNKKPAWNKGLTKETDSRVKANAVAVGKSKTGRKFTEEHKKALSEAQIRRRQKERGT